MNKKGNGRKTDRQRSDKNVVNNDNTWRDNERGEMHANPKMMDLVWCYLTQVQSRFSNNPHATHANAWHNFPPNQNHVQKHWRKISILYPIMFMKFSSSLVHHIYSLELRLNLTFPGYEVTEKCSHTLTQVGGADEREIRATDNFQTR